MVPLLVTNFDRLLRLLDEIGLVEEAVTVCLED